MDRWFRVIECMNLRFQNFPSLNFTPELANDLYNQLVSMVGNKNIYFIPNSNNTSHWYSIFKNTPGSGYCETDYIIGTLIKVEKNIPKYIANMNSLPYTTSIDDVYIQIEIDDKFQNLPLIAYGLNIGLDENYTKYKPYKTNPIDATQKFEIESCKIKGLYFQRLSNYNDYIFNLDEYYGLRRLGMYMYFPGRAYY